jgi:hypothetical protein
MNTLIGDIDIHNNLLVNHQFLDLNPGEEVEYRVFSQHCGKVVERFLNTM